MVKGISLKFIYLLLFFHLIIHDMDTTLDL